MGYGVDLPDFYILLSIAGNKVLSHFVYAKKEVEWGPIALDGD